MLIWKFIKKSSDISFSYTGDELSYLQTFIQGCMYDLTDLVTAKTVFYALSYIKVQKVYVHPDMISNVTVWKFTNEADELINHFATALQFDISTGDLERMLFSYPIAAMDIIYMV
ncbi:hypothetical protein [Planococcus lenghuensis]|uniref:Uncharacterized protein n=1 Tax=Planococcus lenghuensis TaxID=2213202 RepID=A0A1Q2KZJ4_9BACL|nr:hypothetical protein [Planococcus lenghuensis]AQQ53227.1 hypothetical protein B0X71_09150 [Planococcus lenghuensis]